MLSLRDINTFYGNIQALKGVSVEVEEGEIITLIGANGAGKTTTLMSISGIVPPRSGEVRFLGEPIT
ncbi:MAG: ATP-binding cassette domain-containing protein, partial [Desulfosarcina sp.]